MGIGDRDYMRSKDPVEFLLRKRRGSNFFSINPVKAICHLYPNICNSISFWAWLDQGFRVSGEYPIGALQKAAFW